MRERELSTNLLPALVAGDPQAADRLFVTWGPVVLRWCARLGGPQIDEEDAAHDVFEQVFAKVHTLRDPRAFPAWLYAATRRVVIDHRRRAWLRRWVPGLVPDRADPHAERKSERDALAVGVRAALDLLPTDLREVLVLCEMEERNATEVADLLGVPLGTVKSRLRRAREQFAEQARRRGLEPDHDLGVDAECG